MTVCEAKAKERCEGLVSDVAIGSVTRGQSDGSSTGFRIRTDKESGQVLKLEPREQMIVLCYQGRGCDYYVLWVLARTLWYEELMHLLADLEHSVSF